MEQTIALHDMLAANKVEVTQAILLEVAKDEILQRQGVQSHQAFESRAQTHDNLSHLVHSYYESCGILVRIDGNRPLEQVAQDMSRAVRLKS